MANNIYVGFHDQRSSSRVLKPPGGGTSDIFGTDALKVKKEDEKSAPGTKDHVDANEHEQKSDSSNVNGAHQGGHDSNSEQPNIANLSIKEENGEKAEDHQSETKAEPKPDSIGSIIRQDDKVESPPPSPVVAAEPTEKKTPQRVPPGGFSSGLW